MTTYSDIIIEHFENPKNLGEVTEPSAFARVGDPVCGDTIELGVICQEGRVKEAKFHAYGCAPALALGSVLTIFLEGTSPEQIMEVDEEKVASLLGGLEPNQQHVAALGRRVLKTLHTELTRRKVP